MRLTRRLLVIIVPTVVIGLVAIFTAVSFLVLYNFQQVETESEQALLRRLSATIEEDLERHDSATRDWAHWSETYAYLNGSNPGFPEAQFYPASYANNRLSFVVILDLDGTIVNATGFDPDATRFLPLANDLVSAEARAAIGLQSLATDDGHLVGIMTVDGEPHMVSAWAVLTSEETGPAVGTMVWGSKISGTYAEELAERRNQDFQLIPWSQATASEKGRLADREIVVQSSMLQDEVLVGELRIDDLLGQPAMVIHHTAPRTTYQQGLEAMTYSFFAALAVGLSFMAVGLLLVRSRVTQPVAQLSARIREIRSGSPDHGLPTEGDDEVATMAQDFQGLLATLDEREAKLVERNRDLDSFASVVSHDLLSPLSTVNLNAKILEGDIERGDKVQGREHVERIQRTSKAIEERVRALLAYARAGKDAGAPVPVDGNAVLRAVLAEMSADVQASGARIEAEAIPKVMGNEQLLKQVLQNLISNAIKYHKPDQAAQVRISATEKDGQCRIVVADDGVGFDDADVAQMLTPFKRLDRTRATPGHGIGLASCARIMERMGGRLELHGQADVGGEATIVLPAAPTGHPG